MMLRTCVMPEGRFTWGIHRPVFTVKNLRAEDHICFLGAADDGSPVDNRENFPEGDLDFPENDWIYEIPNAFPFRGSTFISKHWADLAAENIASIRIAGKKPCSLTRSITRVFGHVPEEKRAEFINSLDDALKIALAVNSSDPEELVILAKNACEFIMDKSGSVEGIRYRIGRNRAAEPMILNQHLYEAVANNPNLPDSYKEAMVLRPGVQGKSPIVGDFRGKSHVFEYLRANSYIPWGHFAANMAHDRIRYRIEDLTEDDMKALRYLYYQRTYLRVAEVLDIKVLKKAALPDYDWIEDLRRKIKGKLAVAKPTFNRTLWGWNFGFDYSPSHYRLMASHQQVHQQYALIPSSFSGIEPGDSSISPFAAGDLVEEFASAYRLTHRKDFFPAYIEAIFNNRRTDGNKGPKELVLFSDDNVVLFVPKAQTSQWELQLMTIKPVGNIIEADNLVRDSLDTALYIGMKILSGLGASLVTIFEYSKRIGSVENDSRIIYCILPRLPMSPGAFSEAQLRWISRHYPEDFAAACRAQKDSVSS